MSDSLLVFGVGYLAWLGTQMLRVSVRPPSSAERDRVAAPEAGRRVFLRSFTVAVSNPKGYLFFLALLPAFMYPEQGALPQYSRLAITFAAIDAVVLLVYAGAGAWGVARLSTAGPSAWLDRASGIALLCMAAGLALWSRQ